ncbi:MAG: alpha/beta hydrolase [Spirochaetota bacterium]
MLKKIALTLLLILAAGCDALDPFDDVIIGSTDSFPLYSQSVHDTYEIFVYLPPGYFRDGAPLPLLVGLDGDLSFWDQAAILSTEIKESSVRPCIFASIGYGSEDECDRKRNRDLTPTRTEGIEDYKTGEADAFYEFIRTELVPEIENRYNIIPGNTKALYGHSYGGLFAYYALFQDRHTNVFDKFIAAGTSFWYDEGVILEYEEAFSTQNSDLPVTVYTAMGSLEGVAMCAYFKVMNRRIKQRNYPHIVYKDKLLKGFGHDRSDYETFRRGIRFVLPK